MNSRTQWPILVTMILLATLSTAAQALAGELPSPEPQTGYHLGDGSDPDSGVNPGPNASAAQQGPVRLTRISYASGNVTWRPDQSESWSAASANLPMRQGAQVWVSDGGRAEIQFDDGAMLRLASGAIVTLTTLYSDADGEFTEIQMQEGLSTLVLKHAHSIYQIDTPTVSIKSDGPSAVRIGVSSDTEIAVHEGKATIHGASGTTVVQAGSYLDLANANAPFEVGSIPSPDDWDRWNRDRDASLANADSQRYLPSNIALVAGDLDTYGVWRVDPEYGRVWCPRQPYADWRPYHDGSWTWVEPFGWTWVSREPWGWAPYHYGTWVYQSYGWAWCPGPARQYWCPAVVHFSEYNGSVAWCPLAPREIHYPPVLSVGFGHGDWSVFFSIGGAACYYPAGPTYCEPQRFNTFEVNHERFGHFAPNIVNVVTGNGPRYNVYAGAFVPFNARNSACVTVTAVASFGGRAVYTTPGRGTTDFFVRGRALVPDSRGGSAFSGPIGIRPTAFSFTPSRTVQQFRPAPAILQRPVYRAPLPAHVAAFAPPTDRMHLLPASPRAGFVAPVSKNDGFAPRTQSNPRTEGFVPRTQGNPRNDGFTPQPQVNQRDNGFAPRTQSPTNPGNNGFTPQPQNNPNTTWRPQQNGNNSGRFGGTPTNPQKSTTVRPAPAPATSGTYNKQNTGLLNTPPPTRRYQVNTTTPTGSFNHTAQPSGSFGMRPSQSTPAKPTGTKPTGNKPPHDNKNQPDNKP